MLYFKHVHWKMYTEKAWKCSPSIFHSFLSKVLSGIENIVIYQDNILIVTLSISEHNVILYQVLQCLKDTGIKLKTNKCSFNVNSVKYLWYIFSTDGVHPNPQKVSAITNAPTSNTVKQVQSILGLCNLYNYFIRNSSTVVVASL